MTQTDIELIRQSFDRLTPYAALIGDLFNKRLAETAPDIASIFGSYFEERGNKFQVRVPGEFALASEIENILLAEINGRPVYLSDVATVRDTFKDVESISRINGRPSVSLSVKKRSGENTVALISRIKVVLDDFNLAPDIRMSVVLDESDYIYMMLHELENNIVTGFLLVIAVLLVFMGGRNSLFVALAILLGSNIIQFLNLLPMSILGVLLMFAGVQLTLTIMDLEHRKDYFVATLILGITLASNLAAGFIAGMIIAHTLRWDKLTV